MPITMSPQDYATAFRLLAGTARHHLNIAQVVEERVLPRLPEKPSLLDVGAGPGTVAAQLATHFGAITLIEPNPVQTGGLQLEGAKLHHGTLESYVSQGSPERHDLVLCSHMLYHVPLADWGAAVDRMLALVRPGGYCLILLGAPRGPNYEMHRDFSDSFLSSAQLLDTLRQKQIPFEVVPTMNGFTAASLDEMSALCRFFVLEDCYTAEQVAALTEAQARALEEKIRAHAEKLRGEDGVYRLEQDDDVVLLRVAAT